MKQKIDKLVNLAKTTTAKNTYLVFIGNSIAGFIGMIIMLIVSRNLGPAKFGIFSVAFSFLTLLVKFSDLGLNFAMVKDISQSRAKREKEQINKIFLTVFWVKALASFILITISYFFIGFISRRFFGSPKSIAMNRLVAAFFFLAVFYDLMRVYLQANKQFRRSVLMYFFTNLLKLIMVLSCFVFNLRFELLIMVYIIAPFLASLVFYKKTTIKIKFYFNKQIFKNLLKFTRWMAVSVIFAAIGENLNVFMVSVKLSSFQTGIYSAAEKFLLPCYIFAAALSTVLVPRASELLELKQIKSFIKKIGIVQIFLLIFFIVIYPLASFLPVLLGSQYSSSVSVLRILIIAGFFRVAITPLNSVFYPLDKPVIFAIDSIVQVVIMFVLNQKFIALFQARGAALSMLFTNIVIFFFNYLFLYFILKNHEKKTVHLG